MKKLSLLKKLRLAFMAEGWLIKLLIMIYPLFMFSMMFDDESGFLKGMSTVCYGVLIGSMSIVYLSVVTSNMKLYKTMPMKPADIVDIMSLHTLIGIIIVAIPYTVLLPLAGKLDMLPYFICTDCVFLGATSLFIIWYAKDKYVYAQAKDRNEEESVVKKNVRRVGIISVGYMLLEGIIGFLILWQGVAAPDLSADTPWLIAVSAVGLIIYTAVALGARKIKSAFMY